MILRYLVECTSSVFHCLAHTSRAMLAILVAQSILFPSVWSCRQEAMI